MNRIPDDGPPPEPLIRERPWNDEAVEIRNVSRYRSMPDGREYLRTSTPSMLTKCDRCKHSLGDHYVAFRGDKKGCCWSYSPPSGPQQGEVNTCRCTGFAIILEYEP